jgi:hypothetical protein
MANHLWARRTLLAGAFAVAGVGLLGCSPINMAYWLWKGDGKQAPVYPLTPIDKERPDVRVVVMATNAAGMPWEFAGIDREVANQMAKTLAEESHKDSKQKNKFKIIRNEDVDRYKASNPNWRTMNPGALAAGLNADYVIDVSINGVGLYQPGSGKEIYQGWAIADVTVYQSGQSSPPHNYSHKTTMHPQSGDTPIGQYRTELVKQFAYELATKHIRHTPDSSRVAPLAR